MFYFKFVCICRLNYKYRAVNKYLFTRSNNISFRLQLKNILVRCNLIIPKHNMVISYDMTVWWHLLMFAGGGAWRSDPCRNRGSEETGSQADVRRAGAPLPELEPPAEKSRWPSNTITIVSLTGEGAKTRLKEVIYASTGFTLVSHHHMGSPAVFLLLWP